MHDKELLLLLLIPLLSFGVFEGYQAYAQSQVTVTGSSGQTANLLIAETFGGTDQFWIEIDGTIYTLDDIVLRSGTGFNARIGHAISGSHVYTLPDNSGTFVLNNNTVTLTGKTLDCSNNTCTISINQLTDANTTACEDNFILVWQASNSTFLCEANTGAGETNTFASVGGGVQQNATKSGVELRIKSLNSTKGITISSNATDITIDTNFEVHSVTCGGDQKVSSYNNATGVFTCSADTNTGEVNTLASLGNGVQINATKSGVELRIKSINGTGGVIVSSNNTDIIIDGSTIDTTIDNTYSSVGGGVQLNATKSGIDLRVKSLNSTQGITITSNATDVIINTNFKASTLTCSGDDKFSAYNNVTGLFTCTADTGGGGGEINTLASVGNGVQINATKSGTELRVKSINGTGGISVSSNATDVIIDGSGITLDIISEGDSNVEVIDAGSGNINLDVDGSLQFNFNATHFDVNTNQIAGSMTCTNGQILEYNSATDVWDCGTDDGGASGSPFIQTEYQIIFVNATGVYEQNSVTGAIESSETGGDVETFFENAFVGGGTFHVKAGTFEINDQINIPDNVVLKGEGIGQTILRFVNNTGDIANVDNVLRLNSVENVTIRHLTIDANNRTLNSGFTGDGINFGSSNKITIDNVEVINTGGDGIGGTRTNWFTVRDSSIHNVNTHGINYISANHSRIINNDIYDTGSFGISVSDSAQNPPRQWSLGNVIMGNILNNTFHEAIGVSGTDRTVIVGNTMNHTGDTGISVNRANSTTIVANTIANTVGASIIITDSALNLEVSNNTMIGFNILINPNKDDLADRGMINVQGQHTTIIGNFGMDTRNPPIPLEEGIRCWDSCEHLTVAFNDFTNLFLNTTDPSFSAISNTAGATDIEVFGNKPTNVFDNIIQPNSEFQNFINMTGGADIYLDDTTGSIFFDSGTGGSNNDRIYGTGGNIIRLNVQAEDIAQVRGSGFEILGANDLLIQSGQRITLDGTFTGDDYITSPSDGRITLFADSSPSSVGSNILFNIDNQNRYNFTATFLNMTNNDIYLDDANGAIFFDSGTGGSNNDRIYGSGGNSIRLNVQAEDIAQVRGSGFEVLGANDLLIQSGQRITLDGTFTGDDYITSPSDGRITLFADTTADGVGSNILFNIDNANEYNFTSSYLNVTTNQIAGSMTCTNGQILEYNSATDVWDCGTDDGGTFARSSSDVVGASNADDTTNVDRLADNVDDDVTIDASFADIGTSGGSTKLTEGLFTIGNAGGTIDAVANMTLIGEGHSTILKFADGTASTSLVFINNVNNTEIRSLTFDGNCDNNPFQEDVTNCPTGFTDSILTNQANPFGDLKIIDSNFIDTKRHAIHVQSPKFTTTKENIKVIDNLFKDIGGQAIRLFGTDKSIVALNIIDQYALNNTIGRGINFADIDNAVVGLNVIQGNATQDNASFGISLLEGSENIAVVGMSIDGAKRDAYNAVFSDNIVWSGIVSDQAQDGGIAIGGGVDGNATNQVLTGFAFRNNLEIGVNLGTGTNSTKNIVVNAGIVDQTQNLEGIRANTAGGHQLRNIIFNSLISNGTASDHGFQFTDDIDGYILTSSISSNNFADLDDTPTNSSAQRQIALNLPYSMNTEFHHDGEFANFTVAGTSSEAFFGGVLNFTTLAGGTCTNGQILEYNSATDVWDCGTDDTGSGASGEGEKFNEPDYLVFKNSTSNYAVNGTTGLIEYTNSDAVALLEILFTDLTTKNNGGYVFVTSGNYTQTQKLELQPNIKLVGAGMNATIFYMADSTNAKILELSGDDNVIIQDMTFDGNSANNGVAVTSIGIAVTNSDYFNINHVELFDIPDTYIQTTNSSFGLIENNFLHGNQTVGNKHGIHIYSDSDYNVVRANVLDGGRDVGCTDAGSCAGDLVGYMNFGIIASANPDACDQNTGILENDECASPDGLLITENRVINTNLEGIAVQNGTSHRIIGNYVNFTGDACYTVDRSDRVTLDSNYGAYCRNDGMLVASHADEVILTSNIIEEHGLGQSSGCFAVIGFAGISPSEKILIDGNQCIQSHSTAFQDYSVRLDTNLHDKIIITNNFFDDPDVEHISIGNSATKYVSWNNWGNSPEKITNLVRADIDLVDNTIFNVSSISSNSTNVPTASWLNLGNDEAIAWRTSENDADFTMRVQSGEILMLETNDQVPIRGQNNVATPADGTTILSIEGRGKDDAGGNKVYAKTFYQVFDDSASNADGKWVLQVMDNNALVPYIRAGIDGNRYLELLKTIDVDGNDIIIDADADSRWEHGKDDQTSLYLANTVEYNFTSTFLNVTNNDIYLDNTDGAIFFDSGTGGSNNDRIYGSGGNIIRLNVQAEDIAQVRGSGFEILGANDLLIQSGSQITLDGLFAGDDYITSPSDGRITIFADSTPSSVGSNVLFNIDNANEYNFTATQLNMNGNNLNMSRIGGNGGDIYLDGGGASSGRLYLDGEQASPNDYIGQDIAGVNSLNLVLAGTEEFRLNIVGLGMQQGNIISLDTLATGSSAENLRSDGSNIILQNNDVDVYVPTVSGVSHFITNTTGVADPRTTILTASGAILQIASTPAKATFDGTNRDWIQLNYDDTAVETALWEWQVPDHFDSAKPLTATVYYNATSTSGNACFEGSWRGLANSEAIDVSTPESGVQAFSEAVEGTSGNLNISTVLTWTSSQHGLSAGDMSIFNMTRDPTCASDTVGDVGVLSVRIEWQGTGN